MRRFGILALLGFLGCSSLSRAESLLPEPWQIQQVRTITCGTRMQPSIESFPPTVRQPTAVETAEIRNVEKGFAKWEEDSPSIARAREQKARRVVAILGATYGPEHPVTARAELTVALYLGSQLRQAEATKVYSAAVGKLTRRLGAEHCSTIDASESLVQSLLAEGRNADAAALTRKRMVVADRVFGKQSNQWNALTDELADALDRDHKSDQAIEARSMATRAASAPIPSDQRLEQERLNQLYEDKQWSLLAAYHRAEAVKMARAPNADPARIRQQLAVLAAFLAMSGDFSDEPAFRAAAAYADEALGPKPGRAEYIAQAMAWANLGRSLLVNGKPQEAAELLDKACDQSSLFGYDDAYTEVTHAQPDPRAAGDCRVDQANALRGIPSSSSSENVARMEDAFRLVQPGFVSEATRSLGRTAARMAAIAAGKGDLLAEGEKAQGEAQDVAITLSGQEDDNGNLKIRGGTAADQRLALEERRKERKRRASEVSEQLQQEVSGYADFLNPLPTGFDDLRAVLRAGEAMVVWVIRPQDRQGLVFAVSKTDQAWADLPLSGIQIGAKVASLRAMIDPCSTDQATECGKDLGRSFDPTLARELYMALLGSPDVARVIGPASTLIVVPSPMLASLPPGVLVPTTSSETSNAQVDWLVRSKAIAVLPGVAELTTLRRLPEPQSQMKSLFMMAEPDFSGRRMTARPPLAADSISPVPRLARIQVPNGEPDFRQIVSRLPGLPGTRFEANEMQKAFAAEPSDVLLYDAATEEALRARSRSGDLAQTRVVAFATHGLLPQGDVLSDGALALSPSWRSSNPDNDGLLTAPEIASLKLTAELVVLSACNTGAPSADDAQANFSGLARAFLYAGARALLVSNWRVDDAVAPALMERAFAEMNAGADRATAFQRASLAILDGRAAKAPDGDDDLLVAIRIRQSHPAFWAAFTYIGAP